MVEFFVVPPFGELSMADGQVTEAAVQGVLAEFKDPETGRSVVEMGQIHDVRLAGDSLSLTLALTTHSSPLWKETQAELVQPGGISTTL